MILSLALLAVSAQAGKPWDNGKLKVSDNQRYLQFDNGQPFFWQGETGWLLPERLDRAEAEWYLQSCAKAGYNVVQVQTIDGVPAINIYGQMSNIDGWNFKDINKKGVYGYWDHMDFIVDMAAQHGIYIGMVCIWGGLVKDGKLSVEDAKKYGTFLANRYKNKPNIIWFMGGDIQGNIKPEVWEALATTIKSIDKNHLMTYHPRGRYTSAKWWSKADWMDFHTFQSGHRRYGQRMGNADYPIPDNTEEDNMSTQRGSTTPSSLCSMQSLHTRIFPWACTTLTKPAGRTTTCVGMPTGAYLQVAVVTPMAITPSCRC